MSAALARYANPAADLGHASATAPVHADPRLELAGAPRLKLCDDGNWRGVPRVPVDSAARAPTELDIAIYSAEYTCADSAQVNFAVGRWHMAMYCTPEQLREFAALLTDSADLIDMLARLDHEADNADDDGPHIVPDSAERLQARTTNGIGAPQ